MSVWPVASHTCTPDGTGIIIAPPQHIEHAAQRGGVDIGVDANPLAPAEIDLDQAGLLRHGSGRTRRLFR
jgi:hypothetical protein